MSDMKHTPEPWSIVTDEREGIIIKGSESDFIAWSHDYEDCGNSNTDNHEFNFARIAACVNACAGMENPAAEIAKLREAVEYWKSRAQQ